MTAMRNEVVFFLSGISPFEQNSKVQSPTKAIAQLSLTFVVKIPFHKQPTTKSYCLSPYSSIPTIGASINGCPFQTFRQHITDNTNRTEKRQLSGRKT
ncbi:unnamed protein product [Linum trigynum]|uniref:Uncharacterized protein n=1 Tax=Linum trigynum TaxID=586398 RepID=A0AAV2FLI2_9ROSI